MTANSTEALRLRLEAVQQELAEQTAGADVAEAYGVFLHELANVLNTLVLEVRLLEREAPEECRGRLREIGRLAGSVPNLVSHLSRYRQGRRSPPVAVDLNRVAFEVVERLGRAGAVRLELAAALPPVAGTPGALGRVVRLLLDNALGVTPPGAGPVTLRTEHTADRVRLAIEDGGPAVPDEALHALLDAPFTPGREGQNPLELAVCAALARRLQGKLRAVNRPEGGMAFIAEFPPSADAPPPPR